MNGSCSLTSVPSGLCLTEMSGHSGVSAGGVGSEFEPCSLAGQIKPEC